MSEVGGTVQDAHASLGEADVTVREAHVKLIVEILAKHAAASAAFTRGAPRATLP